MQLIQSSYLHLNSTFSTPSGEVLYKTTTSGILDPDQTTTIACAIPNDIVKEDNLDNTITEDDSHLIQKRFGTLALIKWRVFSSTSVRFRGEEILLTELFRKQGLGWFGRDRIFTAEDGKEYKWIIGEGGKAPLLILNDSTKTHIAKYHRRHYGVFGPAKKPYLEIFPLGEHMLDIIFVTFVCIEKIREDRDGAQ